MIESDRIITASPFSSREEAIERALRPVQLNDYVGQERIREQLNIFIKAGVVHNADGTVDVAHSAITYVIDDTGTVLVEWPFGTEPDAMADDLSVLLEQQQA